jgi:UDP-glucose 4-epimerase
MKNILVVGGAGFIGSQVNDMLQDAGYNTLILDNLSTGSRKTIQAGTLFVGDMADTKLLDKIFKENHCDAVMHFAALIDVGESMMNPAKYYENNIVNTLNLLNAMQRHNVKMFIFSSSAAVYGKPKNPLKAISEKQECHPINPYGESKLMVEKILRDFDRSYGLRYCALRYFNAAGGDPKGIIKNYKTKEHNLIPTLLRSIKNPGDPLTINGTDYDTPDGTCIRDYIHIHDLGTAHISAMEQLLAGKLSNSYNLGNGMGYSIKEVINAAEKVTGAKIKVVEGPRREGDPPILIADAQKAKRELNWQPRYPKIETIIEDAWKAMI